MKEVREVSHLNRRESGARTAALHRVAFSEKWSDGISVAIVQDNDRADQIGCVLFASCLLTVAGYALGNVYALSAVGPGCVHYMHVHGTGGRLTRGPACSGGRIVLGRQILGEVIEDLSELLAGCLRAFGNHTGDHFGPLLPGLALTDGDLRAMAGAADFLRYLSSGGGGELSVSGVGACQGRDENGGGSEKGGRSIHRGSSGRH